MNEKSCIGLCRYRININDNRLFIVNNLYVRKSGGITEMFRISILAILIMSIMCVYTNADPYPVDSLTPLYQAAANYIISQSGLDANGNCVVFGAGEGRLAYELSLLSGLKFTGVEEDENKVNSGRAALCNEGIYGNTITLHNQSLTNVYYSDYAGILVVSDSIIETGTCSGSAAELFRMIRPSGGIAIIGQPTGCPNVLSRTELENWLDAASLTYTITEDANGLWARIDRGDIPGAGEWTHMWGDLGNTACSDDELTSTDLQTLWYGYPDSRMLVERHSRAMSPLYKNGKLVIPTINGIVCVDAYNGAKFWELYIADSSRAAIDQDCGWLELTDDWLYAVAQDDCHKIDLYYGTIQDTLHPPVGTGDWGYIGILEDKIYGTEMRANASRIGGTTGQWSWSQSLTAPYAVSRRFFCLNASDGSTAWTYDENSVIVNSCICIGGDGVYFYETYNSSAVSDGDGRVGVSTLMPQGNLVKLNRTNGNLVWREPVSFNFLHAIYLSYNNDILVLTGVHRDGKTPKYEHYAYYASTGVTNWKAFYNGVSLGDGIDYEHGRHDKHPIIVDNKFYTKFGSKDLQTGNNLFFNWETDKYHCTDMTASKKHIFHRQGSLYMKAFPGYGGDTYISQNARPGCYMEMISGGGGLIMMPPASILCDCDYPLKATFVWWPR